MKNFIILSGLIIMLLSACGSFLDVKSDATYVVPHSLSDAQALLDDFFRMNEGTVPTWGESFTDDYYLGEDALKSYGEGSNGLSYYKFNYQDYYGHAYDWGYAYAAIYNANLAMEIVKDVKKTDYNQVDWDNVMGSALFYRAFYFYGLMTNFALAYDEESADTDLGIVLRLNSDFNEKSTRASVRACFEQIILDLESAAGYLPDYPTIVTRPSKGAAWAALAKVYLYMRDYDKALFYSEKGMLLNSELMDFNNDSDIVDINPLFTPFVEFNKEIIFYAEMRAGSFYPATSGTIDSSLFKQYSTKDLRLPLFFYFKNGLPTFRGNYTVRNRGFGGLSTNELYLTKAECLAKLNRNEEAMNVMDLLLERRIKDYKRSDYVQGSSSVLDFIRGERRKELVYRNSRFSDIKRYNKEGEEIWIKRLVDGKEYVLEPNSPKYALPLPSDLIRLTGMLQNKYD